MQKNENTLEWCLKQGEKGGRHRGIRNIRPNSAESENHIKKALHNLRAVDHNSKEFPDWAVSAVFYAMYHALLAILFKLGYESRNQECTMVIIESLIDRKKINFDKRYVEMIRRTGEMLPSDAKTLREEFQYGTEVSVNPEILNNLKENAIEFVEAAQICLEKI